MASGRILRGDGKKGATFFSSIIQEFEQHTIGPQFAGSSSVLAGAVPFNDRTNTRFANFLSEIPPSQTRLHRFMFLGVLSTSRTFMEVFTTARDGFWISLLTELDKHMVVVNFYARSRLLPWREALINYFDRIGDVGPDSAPFRSGAWPAVVPPHPLGLDDNIFQGNHHHTFYLRLDGGTGRNTVVSGSRKNVSMENIDNCIYDARGWPRTAPPTWPANRIYRDHPQNIRNATVGVPAAQANDFLRCGSCRKTFVDISSDDTGCKCHSWRVEHPCVQVHEYPPFPAAPDLVNKGVMAMQPFESRKIIGEYVGQLLPPGRTDPALKNNIFADDVYTIDLNAAVMGQENGRVTSMPGGKIADVSAGWRGNWTRFINTSPRKADWNVELVQWLIADRIRILVRTIKPIAFGEQLIASYGTDYMKSLFGPDWKP
ncbi:hypothetical protein V495_01343 [Pseudogymnoascus sp. VKM F-4514 (FW-929)]|nr:hypothetical protein V495_01343 [Pseudogymnoascus sp. VKM F-4514 (FW-929)]KFY63394.1 hypothetical protein V497_02036 [Pseudogymnoascus sp. VKM F-4516 (FW-969)]